MFYIWTNSSASWNDHTVSKQAPLPPQTSSEIKSQAWKGWWLPASFWTLLKCQSKGRNRLFLISLRIWPQYHISCNWNLQSLILTAPLCSKGDCYFSERGKHWKTYLLYSSLGPSYIDSPKCGAHWKRIRVTRWSFSPRHWIKKTRLR